MNMSTHTKFRSTEIQAIIETNSSTPITKLRSAAYVHDVAGDKSGLVRKEKHARISNDIALGAVAQCVNFVEISVDLVGITLLAGPLAQHGSPYPRRADRIDANAVAGVIQCH